jgi:transketolase
VLRVGDANDTGRLAQAIATFRHTPDVPTLIIVESHIGYGAPHKHDTSAAHGEPLGEEEIRLAKRNYGWPEDAKFLVPDGVREHFREGMGRRGRGLHEAWKTLFDPTEESTQILPTRSSVCRDASFLMAGKRTFRFLPPTRRALPHATLLARC